MSCNCGLSTIHTRMLLGNKGRPNSCLTDFIKEISAYVCLFKIRPQYRGSCPCSRIINFSAGEILGRNHLLQGFLGYSLERSRHQRFAIYISISDIVRWELVMRSQSQAVVYLTLVMHRNHF